MATEGNSPNKDYLTKITNQFEEQIDLLPRIKDPDAVNAVTVYDNKSRHNDKPFFTRKNSSTSKRGGV
jgi:hypothetical protein